MTFEEFEETVEDSLNNLPAKFRKILDDNSIMVLPRARVPGPLKKANSGRTVFGVFVGVPYGHFVNIQTEPTRIELYKESFENYFPDAVEIKKQILSTVIHEIAHYFGFSEREIRKLGY